MDNLNDSETKGVEDSEQDIFDNSADELEIKLEEEDTDLEGHTLAPGQALNEKELYQLSSRKKTKIIYVLGPVGSGKTTFEAMLYAYFLKNIDDEILFSGSETLVGFEERLNYLRTRSGSSDPKMARTSKDERRCFLHFNLLDIKTNSHHNIVFSDISGETFENCNTNRSSMEQDLQYLGMAKNIVLFIDGKALLDNSTRQSCVMKIKCFLKTFKSSIFYNKNCCIDIIISKNDLIYDDTREHPNEYIDNLENMFQEFREDFLMNFFRIEALNDFDIKDEDNSKKLIDLLKYWIQDDVEKETSNPIETTKERHIYNDFNRFGERH